MARTLPWLVVAALAAGVTPDARADMYYAPPPPPKPPTDEFWREVVAPHGDEISMILDKARMAWGYTSNCIYQDCDATGEAKASYLDDAYGMLKYARKLDPTQPDVLLLLGQIAEESGRPAAAIEALQAYIATLAPDATVPPDASMRLGRAYLRQGHVDDAIRQLRAAIGPGVMYGGAPAAAYAYLGTALMGSGRIADAIDVLAPLEQQIAQSGYYYQPEVMQVMMTLAVAYDRDEQISGAFSALDSLQQQLTTSYGQYVQQALQAMVFVPAYDLHYFLGLFYESQGLFAEARTEWLSYAEVEDAPFRGRALDHAAAIDRLLADKLAAAQKAARDAAIAAKKAAKKGKKGGATVAPPPPPPIYPTPYP